MMEKLKEVSVVIIMAWSVLVLFKDLTVFYDESIFAVRAVAIMALLFIAFVKVKE